MIYMASSFTWLDYSENDRKIVLDILEAFKEHEARGELGIGVVRDAFSDMLFPGTSTIQTRAKYFLFVPWLFFIRYITPACILFIFLERTGCLNLVRP